MLSRKVLLIALLAVVLLGSFLDGSVSADGIRRKKSRKAETAAGGVAEVDRNFHLASLTNLMDQITAGIAAVDPNDLQASLKGRKPRRSRTSIGEDALNQLTFTDQLKRRRVKPKASIEASDLNQIAVGAATVDPNNYQTSLAALRRRGGRKGKV